MTETPIENRAERASGLVGSGLKPGLKAMEYRSILSILRHRYEAFSEDSSMRVEAERDFVSGMRAIRQKNWAGVARVIERLEYYILCDEGDLA